SSWPAAASLGPGRGWGGWYHARAAFPRQSTPWNFDRVRRHLQPRADGAVLQALGRHIRPRMEAGSPYGPGARRLLMGLFRRRLGTNMGARDLRYRHWMGSGRQAGVDVHRWLIYLLRSQGGGGPSS